MADASMRRNDSRAALSNAINDEVKNCDTPHNMTKNPNDLRIQYMLHPQTLLTIRLQIMMGGCYGGS